MALSLVSLNIEGSKHLATALPFVVSRNADIVCIQELLGRDIKRFEEAFGAPCFYAPMTLLPPGAPLNQTEEPVPFGIGMFSRVPLTGQRLHYIHEAPEGIRNFIEDTTHTKRQTQHVLMLVSDVEKDGIQYRIGTTHFTWTPEGDADEYQREDIETLFSIAHVEAPLTLCGDFNAPRGREIFSALTTRFKVNIPAHYATSIDVSLHRNGKIRPRDFDDKMVDYLFTTSTYTAKNVELVFGVSDHAAIVATIEKAPH